MCININCDLGESFGIYTIGKDEEMMDWITSANIACGMHAGDPLVMSKTVNSAVKKGVQIGAHPGYPDLQGFGRRNMELNHEELEAYLLYQIGALEAFVRQAGGQLSHVKPHGALYNKASLDMDTARVIVGTVKRIDPHLVLVGQAGSKLIQAGMETGIQTAQEAFPDRKYELDGSLRSRRFHDAVIHDVNQVAQNALRMAKYGIEVNEPGGKPIPVDTICIHGDSPGALEYAKMVYTELSRNGFKISRL